MKNSLSIALAQHDSLVGGLQGNAEKILQWVKRARDEFGADIILFPELNLTGYPPEDLLLRHGFIEDARKVLDELTEKIQGITAIIGCPIQDKSCLYNSAVVIKDGMQIARYDKQNNVFRPLRITACG